MGLIKQVDQGAEAYRRERQANCVYVALVGWLERMGSVLSPPSGGDLPFTRVHPLRTLGLNG